jgi:hypothetical protein
MNLLRTLAAVLALASASPALAGWKGGIEDDYGKAVALAKARNVPLVVDVWAPW